MLCYVDTLASEYRLTLAAVFRLPVAAGFELLEARGWRLFPSLDRISYLDQAIISARNRKRADLERHFRIVPTPAHPPTPTS